MSLAVLYRWRADPAKAKQFEDAWAEGTRLIHQKCGSYGARLHKGEDGLYWSYALWPDEETRKNCFKDTSITEHDSFARMQDAIIETYDEIVLTPVVDELRGLEEK
ncbi:antibiotic biosynthesis monooxygenase [Hyphococcus sp.]|uniref:antibiotic biosynthesis monooxygenase n=1 Tax=Hyphococcus sp. TaxID=2038636 RepID=UPI003CCBD6F9